MWHKCVHKICPLTTLCSTKVKFKWTDIEQKISFMAMKKILGGCVLFSYPNFSEEFIIQTDSIRTQIGELIIQNGKPIFSYSHNLTPSRINFMTI